MKTFEELRLIADHKDSVKRAKSSVFAEIKAVEKAEKKRNRSLGVIGYGHVVQRDERLMKRNAKRGAKGIGKAGMHPTHGPVFITKFDCDGNILDKSIHTVK